MPLGPGSCRVPVSWVRRRHALAAGCRPRRQPWKLLVDAVRGFVCRTRARVARPAILADRPGRGVGAPAGSPRGRELPEVALLGSAAELAERCGGVPPERVCLGGSGGLRALGAPGRELVLGLAAHSAMISASARSGEWRICSLASIWR